MLIYQRVRYTKITEGEHPRLLWWITKGNITSQPNIPTERGTNQPKIHVGVSPTETSLKMLWLQNPQKNPRDGWPPSHRRLRKGPNFQAHTSHGHLSESFTEGSAVGSWDSTEKKNSLIVLYKPRKDSKSIGCDCSICFKGLLYVSSTYLYIYIIYYIYHTYISYIYIYTYIIHIYTYIIHIYTYIIHIYPLCSLLRTAKPSFVNSQISCVKTPPHSFVWTKRVPGCMGYPIPPRGCKTSVSPWK